MKKTYINPTMVVVKLNMKQNLLIGSPVDFAGGGDVTITNEDFDEGGGDIIL